MGLHPADSAVLGAYFVAVLGLGTWLGRHTRSASEFFLAGRRLSWWAIAFSCIATTVGSYSFIKYSAVAFQCGLSSTMTYLNDWFLMPLFLLGWLPLVYFGGVVSIPEYMGRRFDPSVRVVTLVFILVYTLGYIGINLYTMGVALHALIPSVGVLPWAAGVALVTGAYVTSGGQVAVVATDVLQGLLLLAMGLLVGGLGLHRLSAVSGASGLSAFWEGLPPSHRLPFSGFTSPEHFPFVGVFWQDLFGASMFYYLGNQGLILRFLSARSLHEGRKAAVAVLVGLVPLAAVSVSAAGWVGRSMQTWGLIPPQGNANEVFVVVARQLAGPGLFGLVLAALTAALMSTIDTLINAAACLVVNDVVAPRVRRHEPGFSLRIARYSSVGAALVGLVMVPLFMRFRSVYVAHASFTAAISPPVVVAVVAAMLWPRFSARAARVTLVGGALAVAVSIAFPRVIEPWARVHGMAPGTGYTFMRALYGVVVCGALAMVTGLVWPCPRSEAARCLWVGTLRDAVRAFKGAEPNYARGRKVSCALEEAEGEEPVVRISPAVAARLGARAGDLVFVAPRSWWRANLKGFHARVEVGGEGALTAPAPLLRREGLRRGEVVTVEKVC